ncbi:MAG: SRPBCC family protein [Pyrinomonadaceae bacterium]
MTTIRLETTINAPAAACFDLMRDVRIHTETTARTRERTVAGVTDGLIGLGQTVTFEGTHFGMRQRLTVKVVEFERPRLFVDEMIEGRFREFKHTHEFNESEGVTLMTDTLTWESPFGIFGRLADELILKRHLHALVSGRNARLKEIAELEIIGN